MSRTEKETVERKNIKKNLFENEKEKITLSK